MIYLICNSFGWTTTRWERCLWNWASVTGWKNWTSKTHLWSHYRERWLTWRLCLFSIWMDAQPRNLFLHLTPKEWHLFTRSWGAKKTARYSRSTCSIIWQSGSTHPSQRRKSSRRSKSSSPCWKTATQICSRNFIVTHKCFSQCGSKTSTPWRSALNSSTSTMRVLPVRI